MFTLLLCIMFSKTLTFSGLTLPILFTWFCHHPFLFLILVGEVMNGFSINNVNINNGSRWTL